GFEEKLAADTAPYLRDPRHARPDGRRPRFVIYRPEDMPDPQASVARLREGWRRAGIGEVELGAVRFHVEGAHPVHEGLFDFWVEMPPHGLVKGADYLLGGPEGNRMPAGMNPAFSGLIYDYAAVARRALSDTYVRSLPRSTIAGI
ncbi:glycoside hydrolase family 99-like domain-containing protein, partial [Escherichia coli]|uniref:glycoside hydrolase family 99-like domain-containing protein n=1 Tax=Escherichia coli TaxID=562 RepID=UPI001AA14AAB